MTYCILYCIYIYIYSTQFVRYRGPRVDLSLNSTQWQIQEGNSEAAASPLLAQIFFKAAFTRIEGI